MNITTALAAATLALALAANTGLEQPPAFKALRIQHTGSLRVELPPERALELFTGPGERIWVAGWDPVVLSGDGIEAGTVFLTGHGDSSTIWVIVDYDPNTLRARYARTTPEVKAGTVEVRVRPDGEGASEVQVTYELTALSEAGNRDLAHFDASAYSTMMRDWERHIRDAGPEIAKYFGE